MGEAASATISAGSSIMGGFQQRAAARARAKSAEIRSRYQELRAKQVAAAGADQTNKAVEAIRVLRTQRGLSADSPTAQVIEDRAFQEGRDRTSVAVMNELLGRDESLQRASELRSAGNFALLSGFANAASTVAGASDSFGSFFGGDG